MDQAADRLARFFASAVELMQVLARACGHASLAALSPEDLVTWKREVSDLTGVTYGGVGAAWGAGRGRAAAGGVHTLGLRRQFRGLALWVAVGLVIVARSGDAIAQREYAVEIVTQPEGVEVFEGIQA